MWLVESDPWVSNLRLQPIKAVWTTPLTLSTRTVQWAAVAAMPRSGKSPSRRTEDNRSRTLPPMCSLCSPGIVKSRSSVHAGRWVRLLHTPRRQPVQDLGSAPGSGLEFPGRRLFRSSGLLRPPSLSLLAPDSQGVSEKSASEARASRWEGNPSSGSVVPVFLHPLHPS